MLNNACVTTPSITDLHRLIDRDGFAVLPSCLGEITLDSLCTHFTSAQSPERNLLSIPIVRQLATSEPLRNLVHSVLGSKCFAVRGIFFNKTPVSNWKVGWHQDLTIAVRNRKEIPGFGPWTVKAGMVHVQPPAEIMAALLAIRFHLDASDLDNGPLRVIPGSHCDGRLSADKIRSFDKTNFVTCQVPKGGALLMRPLLLHASSSCATPKSRRVIHLEFAPSELSGALEWQHEL